MTDIADPDGGARTLIGECRIEAISVKGQALPLDGLRLRLDLRLAASPDATRRELPVLSRASQRRAAAAGLAALLLALALFRWGPAREHEVPPPVRAAETGSERPVVTVAPPPSVAAPLPVPASGIEPAPGVEAARVAPPSVSRTPAASARAARAPRARLAHPPGAAADPAGSDADATVSATAPAPRATLRTRPDRDLLDLFSDTK